MLFSMLYSWLVVSIHVWLEQCFRRIKTKLMHQFWHFKCIQIQSFGRRKWDFLHGAKQGNSSWIPAWMYQPTKYHTSAPSWCAGLAHGIISLPSRYEMQNQFVFYFIYITWRCDSFPENEGDCFRVGTSSMCSYSQMKWTFLVEIM